jgi:hypothetical protein
LLAVTGAATIATTGGFGPKARFAKLTSKTPIKHAKTTRHGLNVWWNMA